MPHCIIEYSDTLDIAPSLLLEKVQQGLFESEMFDVSHIKTRAMAYSHFQLSIETTNFIHVTLRLHSGRSNIQKKQLTELVMQHIKGLPLKHTTVTMETIDIDTDSYGKHVF